MESIYSRVEKINISLKELELNDEQIIDFWEDCFKIALENYNKKQQGFISSQNALKLSNKINDKLDLKLQPKIKRFIDKTKGVKFLMKDESGTNYFFGGTVLDFLSSDIEIELNRHFCQTCVTCRLFISQL